MVIYNLCGNFTNKTQVYIQGEISRNDEVRERISNEV